MGILFAVRLPTAIKISHVMKPERFRLAHRAMDCLFWCLVLLSSVCPSEAVLFYSTGDPAHNTNAPTGVLTNSGWQYQGAWSTFSGTIIGSNSFITAKHVGGAVGDSFTFQGVEYPALAYYDDPDSDLRIWRVSGQFNAFAPLYSKRDERGKYLVVIGRGTQRGAEVRLKNKLRGWQWGLGDSVQRWGQNRVGSLLDGGPGTGDLLRAAFDAGAGRNEAELSAGDSGGAVFIKDGRTFKLAAINYAVDGPYDMTSSGEGFTAALFDQRGFYTQNQSGTWTLVSGPAWSPGGFYATRISSHITWIKSILALPSP
jgi:hypothetical protein